MGIDQPQVNNDVAAAEANAEGQKLEWGSDLGFFAKPEALERINHLNSELKAGEGKWRLPTTLEFLDALENGIKFEAKKYLIEQQPGSSYNIISITDIERKVPLGCELKAYDMDTNPFSLVLVRDIA